MRVLRNIVGIILISAAFFVLISLGEAQLLNDYVSGVSGPIEEWIDTFRFWANVGVGTALGASLLWYILAQWAFILNDWRRSSKRLIWLLFFLFPIIAIILGIVFTPTPQEGRWWPYFFYVGNPLLCYYLCTLLFSPSSFKYTPLGASKIRYW